MKKLIILLLICIAIIGGYYIDVKSNDYLILVNRTHKLNSDYIPSDLMKPNVKFVSSATDEERMNERRFC